MSGLRNFTEVQNAPRARPAEFAARAVPSSASDPFGARRLTCSKAVTAEGYQRLANDITRAAIGIPFTHVQQDEIRKGKERLTATQIDRNAYRQSAKRSYAPRDTRKRRPGWVK